MSADELMTRMKRNWPTAVAQESAFAIAIYRMSALLQAQASRALVKHELTLTEFEVLAALRSSAPHSLLPTELYDALLISSGGLTKVLKSLEIRGLVERSVEVEDRRRRPVSLTKKGVRLVETAMTDVIASDRSGIARSGLSDDQIELLIQLVSTAQRGFRSTRPT